MHIDTQQEFLLYTHHCINPGISIVIAIQRLNVETSLKCERTQIL